MVESPNAQSAVPVLPERQDAVDEVVSALPALPPVIRYYDEFDDIVRSIAHPTDTDVFELWINGSRKAIDFARFGPGASLLKQLFVFLLAQDFSIQGVLNYIQAAYSLNRRDVADLVEASPVTIGMIWARLRARTMNHLTYSCIKALLRLLCHFRLRGWSPDYHAFISCTLPLPAHDKFAGVRSGDVFLSIAEEAAIVRHLDDVASAVATSGNTPLALTAVADAGMLLCAFQFAMRPVQIARVRCQAVRIWNVAGDDLPAVHVTFHMAKQKTHATQMPLTRRIKREWSPIFLMLEKHGRAQGLEGSARLFAVKSSAEAQLRIGSQIKSLTGTNRCATDLRHTAAQRLVDAGANHEELSAFMGHSDIRTGLIYYDTSATQAERINRALGASEIYRRVAKIAHDRFISEEELAGLKAEQQIAGVPHGIPIAGIGGCSSGQPDCPYNPVTSCYGCRKFMPVLDKSLHERVLDGLRSVVRFFSDASRGDGSLPAYLQLQRTIAQVQTVIAELESAVR